MSENSSNTPGPGHLAILTFHGFGTPASTISFPPAVLRSGLARLTREGYRSVDLLEAVQILRSGEPLPPRALVLTIDDGYESTYREAFPALQEHGMTATVFVTTGRRASRNPSDRLPPIEGQAMVSWRELGEMVGAGFTVGAHTLTHPDLTRLGESEAEAEIVGAKAILEDRLGVSVRSFAYPRGRYDQQAREIAARHYSCACSDRLGLVTRTSDHYALERVEMYYFSRRPIFDLLTTPLLPAYLRFRALPRRARRAWTRSR
jgi:peptidoglycan/xylan/chitin deacetylase (PgdA/CDA1 family)